MNAAKRYTSGPISASEIIVFRGKESRDEKGSWICGCGAVDGFGGILGCGVSTQQEPAPVPQQEGVAAKAGEKLDEFGRAIRRGLYDAEETVRGGLNKTGDTVREGFAKTKESVQGMGLVPRVYGRLHWDKASTAPTCS